MAQTFFTLIIHQIASFVLGRHGRLIASFVCVAAPTEPRVGSIVDRLNDQMHCRSPIAI